MKKFAALSTQEVHQKVYDCDDERLFAIFEALMRGITPEEIHNVTKIDLWFLYKLKNLAQMETSLRTKTLDEDLYREAKRLGYPDKRIESLSGQKIPCFLLASFKMVDTCAAEFEAQTPFYSTYDEACEAKRLLEERKSSKAKRWWCWAPVPSASGQGIEFDYASVQCVWTLKKAGYEVVIINNNPETVSTDFDTADRLYFEPLTPRGCDERHPDRKSHGA